MSTDNTPSNEATPTDSSSEQATPTDKRKIKIGSQREEASQAADPQTIVLKSELVDPAAESSMVSPGDADQSAPAHESDGAKSGFPPPRVQRISQDLQDEIDAALGDVSLDALLTGAAESGARTEIELDSKYPGTIVKIHRDSVFFSLGANHEGVATLKHFSELPEVGAQMDVVPVKFLQEEGLFELIVPGASVDVVDWSDLAEGIVVEATITGSNKGGLECEVKNIRGFIPASQVSIYRVEDFEQFVGEKLLCVVNEANPDRRNLVLSHRAVLEREKQEKREKTLEQLEVGQTREGQVSKIMDFGAFVDLGGIDGLIHVSQLSWDRIKHPSEVMEEGQKVKVRIEKIDSATGKISLSYRDLLVNPWDLVESNYPVGTKVTGTVSKIMEFGAFVRLEAGVEGLVHISELAHHRVHRVSNVVTEGQEVEVKILSVDAKEQKMSLSMKAAQAEAPNPEEMAAKENDPEEPSRKPIVDQHEGPLKGGVSRDSGGEQFGLKW